jgi:hypothetical protein
MLLMQSFSHRPFPIALRAFEMVLLFVALLPHVGAQSPDVPAQDPPDTSHFTPGKFPCEFKGPFLHIPSRAAGSEGLLVRLSVPAAARYPKGAPIAVHMFASRPSVSGSLACLSEEGFIDVGFLCPGTEYRALDGTVWKSGGSPPRQTLAGAYDCVEPLADVLSFATGKTSSLDGKSIQDYTGTVRAMTGNAGIVGYSFGGNLAVLAMARHGERFPGLKWYAGWETAMLGPVDGGTGCGLQWNRFYDPNTGKIDFDRLKYSPTMPIWVWPFQGLARKPDWPRGGLYLDGDGDGVFNRERDYAFWVDVEPGPPLKAFYSPATTRKAVERNVFGGKWPAHIATLEEVEERARRDDALRHIRDAVKKFPSLAVLVFESQQVHVAQPADHPYAVAEVNAWLDVGARWVRFNPDVHYIEAMMGRRPSRVVQCPAGQRLDRQVIRDLLEPEAKDGGPTDKQGMTAVACELADRTYRKKWTPVLTQTLVRQKPKVP